MAQARPPVDPHVPVTVPVPVPSSAYGPPEEVRFAFGGALELARALHGLGDAVDQARTGREQAGAAALAAWVGPAAAELAEWLGVEAGAMAEAADALRREAVAWAEAWARAAEDLGRQRWLAGAVAGGPEPATAPVATPRPPGFEPTGPIGVVPSSVVGR